MIKLDYYNDHLELSFVNQFGELVKFENWPSERISIELFNTLNDLLVNGVASLLDAKRISINYEDLSQIDDFEYEALGIPDFYPYDLFVDIEGGGLTDTNLQIKYFFQDFSHKNGSGENLFFESHRTGAYLKNNLEFLLDPKQYALIKGIEKFNQTQPKTRGSVLRDLSSIQMLAAEANASMSKILVDTIIVAPDKVKVDIQQIDEDRFKLIPIFDEVDNERFIKTFDAYPNVKSVYNLKKENKKVRIVIDDEESDESNSLKSPLTKIKQHGNLTSEEINQIYNDSTSFWNSDRIDLDYFSKRVLELGVYKPRFYPFISPYKSQWIPGILVEDKKEGTRHFPITTEDELEELKKRVNESKAKGESSFLFKGEHIDLGYIDSIIDVVEKQLKSPNEPIATFGDDKVKVEKRVLIIKENTEANEYSEDINEYEDVEYRIQRVSNLAPGIKLKEHQKKGVAWLQTLFSPPYSLPGVLLADDMGLGKTIQVLYFIEWYSQFNDKPILIVAPVSLLENWQAEYIKFFPNPSLESHSLWGKDVKRYIVNDDKDETIRRLSAKAIYLTTYETLRKHQIPLGLINWGVVVLDEAQKVKTPGTLVTNAAKALKASFKIAMTGTPVENSLMDLWCIMDFCSPGLLENAKSFSKAYQEPLKNQSTDIKQLTGELRDRIGITLLRRMKSDVAKDLPPIEYHKYDEPMPNIQYEVYLNELASFEEVKDQEESSSPILQAIHNLRRISDHPFLKHHRVENLDADRLISSSAKLKRVVQVLAKIKEREEKVIIFSENKAMQRVLRKIVTEKFNIAPSIINGETPANTKRLEHSKLTRQQEIDKFQKVSGFNVIIMSPVAAGFGLNITEANHVIHYTRHWNPAKEQQATDRAYRIGQIKPVHVYYPLAISPSKEFKTFDIVLDELLQRKSLLASNTLFPTDKIEISKDDLISSLNCPIDSPILTQVKRMEDLDQLNPLSFLAATALLIEKKEGGVADLVPRLNENSAYIVCLGNTHNYLFIAKQSTSTLGPHLVQEIKYATREYNNKYGKYFTPAVLTNNYFDEEAYKLAAQNDVELFDRDHLLAMIMRHPLDTVELDKKLFSLNRNHTILKD